MSTNKKVVIISGGSRGLGKALVTRCLEDGFIVATFSQSASDFIKTMLDKNASFYWQSIDITDYSALKQFVDTVQKQYKRIDVLINNAGVAAEGILSLSQISSIHQVIDINLKSTIMLSQLCSKQMLRQQAGVIINVSSINAIRGHSGVSIYSASKAGIDGFTRSLARELGPKGIRVNSVAPGYFTSDMVDHFTEKQRNAIIKRTPLGRFSEISDILNAIMFLISANAAFITGHTLVIDGGISC